ncbi:MAG: GMC family oxidoreductase [Rhizomicrobium sp.]
MRILPSTDVVIVGMGAGGATAAEILTKQGLKVVGLEAGPYLTPQDFATGLDEIGGCHVRNDLGEVKYNKEMPTWRYNESVAATDAPAFHNTRMMNGVGGSTVHYGALSWRFTPGDFRVRSDTVKRYGESALPPGSSIADWPVSYDDLEPYYDHVEYAVGVSGKGGVNPFEGPRSRDYPMPPMRAAGFTKLAEKTMRALGYHPFPRPAAVNSVNYDGRAACSYCGFCSGFACWNDSKSSMLVTAIRRAERTGLLEIRPDSVVTRISVDRANRASGVQYRTLSGEMVEQPARFVVLSTYVYENVRRLLLSKSEAFPNGLSNNHGQVGKNYITHTYLSLHGLFPGRDLNLFSGMFGQEMGFDDLYGDNFDHTGLGFIRGVTVFSDFQNLPIASAGEVPPDVPKWGQAYKDWLKTNINSVGTLSATVETLPYESNYLDLDPGPKTDPFGDPVIRVTYDVHDNEKRMGAFAVGHLDKILRAMGATKTWPGNRPVAIPLSGHAFGGTRMGTDPAHSVVDGYSISHEVRNLAIFGGSTFPTVSSYNPTQTIQALSWRSSEYIAANFGRLTS